MTARRRTARASGSSARRRAPTTPTGWPSAARSKDPGLPEETARELAVDAWEHLRAIGELDAPEVARRLMADAPRSGATPANVVAQAAVEFCEEYGVTLS